MLRVPLESSSTYIIAVLQWFYTSQQSQNEAYILYDVDVIFAIYGSLRLSHSHDNSQY